MKIYVLSDLHLEFGEFSPPDLNVDVLILAGDIDVKAGGVAWAKRYFKDIPVIYVLGNHEYYGFSLDEHLASLKGLTKDSNIHVLENESTLIDDVQILGCTLWTDFNLHGNVRSARNIASRYISDYDSIQYGPSKRNIRSADTLALHVRSKKWLLKEFKKTPVGKRVVITHHAPSQKSLPDYFNNNIISAAYASHLDKTVNKSNADLWVHGHVHSHSDYMIGKTRVVCNPRGYSDEPNKNFNPGFVVDI